ncbi:1-deoxy-D-xylulose-5-phosphate reductoisomerase [Proteiniborus sp. MB09-C3]|uniref:1-deoxy-D-xylulose-5-phosphate reductoisomerase n=1 Tax=Proteiniborus sp. MB09-C3 TaxID=3050072 RepID=UPI002553E5EB|nr:1-deoxy-D-xylulose-5-phosphate reductoisomerase [Proteiniborus sp. MB09-C3]WIV13950.1 1-deoxy-D-xylulose-5-phosphate reductoisomerase [Proteiniborus sp. MB09-C3]
MLKGISILGSTGSIGTQALDVIKHSGEYKVIALTTNRNIDLLEQQALEFSPRLVAVMDLDKSKILKDRLRGYNIKVVSGIEGLIEAAAIEGADVVITSVVGMIGLLPTLEAIKSGKKIALANKETLVTAGEIVMKEASKNKVDIIPIDSEHSAIFQGLRCGNRDEVSKLILTASGGPFRGKSTNDLKNIKVEEALKHPNWSMGKKLTIDSATLMNKGLELIEAKWLFNVDIDKIDVIVHPQSIIHSMVEYIDGSIIAHMGIPDMRIPIQYSLTHPKRIGNQLKKLDFIALKELTFELPDTKVFPCLELAYEAIKSGGTMPAVLNASNEVAVELFLSNKIGFLEIPNIIHNVMTRHILIKNPTLDDILESDKWAREVVINRTCN